MNGEAAFWGHLQRQLDARVGAFEGVAAAAVIDLASGTTAATQGDLLFPIASTVKIHLLAALGQLDQEGAIDLDTRVRIEPKVPGSGVLSYLDDLETLSWRDLANLMIMVSDNTATNMILDLISFERMARFLQAWGLQQTRVQRKMQDHAAVAEGRENLASANDLLRMLALLHEGTAFAPGVAEWCLDVLAKPKKSPFASTLPAGLRLANEPGGMDRVRCDAGIVGLEQRPFAMAVLSTFGPIEPEGQVRWVADLGRSIFDAMSVLDATSTHGQGVPPEHRQGRHRPPQHEQWCEALPLPAVGTPIA